MQIRPEPFAASLAGAYWGVEGIPAEWLDGLANRDKLETAVRAITSLLPAQLDRDKMDDEGSDAEQPNRRRANEHSTPKCSTDEAFIETGTFLMSLVSQQERRMVRWDAVREEIV